MAWATRCSVGANKLVSNSILLISNFNPKFLSPCTNSNLMILNKSRWKLHTMCRWIPGRYKRLVKISTFHGWFHNETAIPPQIRRQIILDPIDILRWCCSNRMSEKIKKYTASDVVSYSSTHKAIIIDLTSSVTWFTSSHQSEYINNG